MKTTRFLKILYNNEEERNLFVWSLYAKDGLRDPTEPCESFEKLTAEKSVRKETCYSDGHHLCRHCVNYKLRSNLKVEPVGVDGERDPLHPCTLFAMGEPRGDCWGDGHYMCQECTEYDPNRPERYP